MGRRGNPAECDCARRDRHACRRLILSDPTARSQIGNMVPMRGAYPGSPEQLAAFVAWCVSPENALMTGQILFVDGGLECLARGERSW